MLKRLLTVLTMGSILSAPSIFAFGKGKQDWSDVKSLAGKEVAVKTKTKMRYGVIKSVLADSLILQVAGKKNLTSNEITINRSEIKKVWRAGTAFRK